MNEFKPKNKWGERQQSVQILLNLKTQKKRLGK